MEVTTKREAAITLEGHAAFETRDRLARPEELFQRLQFGMARNFLAGPMDGVAHFPEVVDPDVVDLAALVSEADPHVAPVEFSPTSAFRQRLYGGAHRP